MKTKIKGEDISWSATIWQLWGYGPMVDEGIAEANYYTPRPWRPGPESFIRHGFTYITDSGVHGSYEWKEALS